MIGLIGSQWPFKTKRMNQGQISEEMAVLLLAYHIPFFTDWFSDVKTRYNLGQSFIGICVFLLFVFYLANICLKLV